jgi:hypothetical protein
VTSWTGCYIDGGIGYGFWGYNSGLVWRFNFGASPVATNY